ncbi:MAG: A24 family peptidase, partial [Pseudomonadota bacterium]
PLSSAVIGAMAGYVSLWLVYQIFRLVTGKEGMGYGDFKLFAALGAWLGWQSLPLIILASSLLGAIVGITFILFFGRDRHLPIPFGPFLCLAGWIAALWGDSITRLYLQLARITV